MSLLEPPSPEIALLVDLFIFFSYIVMTGFLLYVGRIVNYRKRLTLPWMIIAGGLLFISLNLFIEIVGITTQVYIIPRPILWYAFNAIGSMALMIGFAGVMAEREAELSGLKTRKLEIGDIMQYLKERYYKKEIGEEDLRRLYTDLVEQMAEIESKIRRLEKKKK